MATVSAYTHGYKIGIRAYKLGGIDAIKKVEVAAWQAGKKKLCRGIESYRLHVMWLGCNKATANEA